jgi:hypothetical protein
MIRHLPIVTPNNQIKTEIIRYVEQLIYDLKAKDGKFNDQIKKKMKEIDVILYKLYSITAEEQKLIESVSNSI